MIFNSYIIFILNNIKNLINNKVLSQVLVVLTLSSFLIYRFPSCFDLFYCVIILVISLLPYFISLTASRLYNDWEEFLCSFTPVGAPLVIAPLVSILEAISYVVRPFVLVLRPFLNLSIGAMGALTLGGFLSSGFNPGLAILFMFLFFYELFVCLVHCFIVSNILIFSIDH